MTSHIARIVTPLPPLHERIYPDVPTTAEHGTGKSIVELLVRDESPMLIPKDVPARGR